MRIIDYIGFVSILIIALGVVIGLVKMSIEFYKNRKWRMEHKGNVITVNFVIDQNGTKKIQIGNDLLFQRTEFEATPANIMLLVTEMEKALERLKKLEQ